MAKPWQHGDDAGAGRSLTGVLPGGACAAAVAESGAMTTARRGTKSARPTSEATRRRGPRWP
eukprot:123271-Prymnesium_polylepis.1